MISAVGRVLLVVRCGLLLGTGGVLTAVVGRLAGDVLGPDLRAYRSGGAAALQALPFPRALVALAVLALLLCWLRLAGSGLVYAVTVVHEALVAPTPGARRVRPAAPPLVRRTVLAALGLSLPAAVLLPAQAARPGADGLAGLALPDRTTGQRDPTRVVIVRPGDSLWSIAGGLLPRGAADERVARECRALHAVNASVIGPDANLIFPGTRLVVPPHDPSGKERL